jgi:hypothetical protein
MISVSKPQISPADDSLTCDPHAPALYPSASPSISPCTPIHSRFDTTERYGMNDLNRSRIRTELAINIAPYILGPMPPDTFLDRFLPSQSISVPEGTSNFQAGMFTSLLPPDATGATDASGAPSATDATGASASGVTKPTPYRALVCPSWPE